jgi:hypothetical protein
MKDKVLRCAQRDTMQLTARLPHICVHRIMPTANQTKMLEWNVLGCLSVHLATACLL